MHTGIEWVVKTPRYQLLHDIKYILTQLHLKSTNSSKMIYREWRQMGNQLNIPELTLDMIEKSYPDSPIETSVLRCFTHGSDWRLECTLSLWTDS